MPNRSGGVKRPPIKYVSSKQRYELKCKINFMHALCCCLDGMDSAPMSPIVTPSTSTPMGSLDSKKLDDAYVMQYLFLSDIILQFIWLSVLLQPTRSHRPSVCPEDAEDFWHKDILKLLSDDLKLRVDIADYFSKVTGASG